MPSSFHLDPTDGLFEFLNVPPVTTALPLPSRALHVLYRQYQSGRTSKHAMEHTWHFLNNVYGHELQRAPAFRRVWHLRLCQKWREWQRNGDPKQAALVSKMLLCKVLRDSAPPRPRLKAVTRTN